MTNDELLQERLDKVRNVISTHGERNFYVAFSGGKDSTILSDLIDVALPGNKIPRVFFNTGIEYPQTRQFVLELGRNDPRITFVLPKVNIRQVLEEHGYPFKSKEHSHKLEVFREKGIWQREVELYLNDRESPYRCPTSLLFQFTDDYPLKISDKCCDYLKKKPADDYSKESGRTIRITGIRRAEKGRRNRAQCTVFQSSTGKLKAFNPLNICADEWTDWYVERMGLRLCDLYYPPFNFKRTGCMGCPFALNLQEELDVLEREAPRTYFACENIWKPVYDEYRRLGYRLRKQEVNENAQQ